MALVTVFGGTGFLGRHIVEHLARDGAIVRIAVRRPAPARGDQLAPVMADIRDENAVAAAVAGADCVVNAVSAYVETSGITYRDVHELGAGNVARACRRQDVQRLVHISGIGADPASPSRYIGARGRGERVVQQAFPRAVILRPSVMFGPDDAFLNSLAKIVRQSPVVPLIGGGRTRLQPVHVGDVAEAVARCLRSPGAEGKTYELGGAKAYGLREIMEMVAARLGRRCRFLPIPFGLAHPMARLAELLPAAPLTVAQVDLLRDDNLPAAGAPGLAELSITPRQLEDMLAALPTSSPSPPERGRGSG
jgi:NADH dehydrogenase